MPVPELGARTLHGAQPVQLVSAIAMCRALEDLQCEPQRRRGLDTACLERCGGDAARLDGFGPLELGEAEHSAGKDGPHRGLPTILGRSRGGGQTGITRGDQVTDAQRGQA